METEIWKDIKDYEGLYQVSNQGRVKSLARVVKHKYSGILTIKERILAGGGFKDDYITVMLAKNGKNKTYTIHRLVGLHFILNPLGLPEVNHLNGDKTNNNDWNLEWSTHRDNNLHAFATGLNKTKGSGNAMAKLNDKQVGEIRALIGKIKGIEIAKIYDVTRSTISLIKLNKTYKHGKI